jgi:hypothetical protein
VRRWVTLALLAMPLAASRTAAQSPAGPALSWSAPEECPDVSAVLARVHAHDPAASTSRSDVRVRAGISRTDGRYQLALRVEEGDAVAERALAGDDCDALADAAALLIALALTRGEDEAVAPNAAKPAEDPELGATADAGAADATGRDQLPGATGSAVASERSEPAADRGERVIRVSPDNEVLERSGGPLGLRFALGAALALDAGMLPRAPALGVEPVLQLQVEYASAQLAGSGAVGKLSLGADLLQAPLVFGPRAVLELGQLAVKTSGVSVPQRGRATWIAAGPALHVGYWVARRLELALELGVLFPFARPRWLLRTPDGAVDLFTAAPAVLRVTSGLAYAFP